MASITLDTLPEFARMVLERISPKEHAFVLLLAGELGAGKTTFMQAFAREMGVAETVQSPTFVLMRSYDISCGTFNRLVHIDAYRLTAPEEFKALKPQEFLTDPHAIVCIEWPERIESEIPAPDLLLRFSHEDAAADARAITIE